MVIKTRLFIVCFCKRSRLGSCKWYHVLRPNGEGALQSITRLGDIQKGSGEKDLHNVHISNLRIVLHQPQAHLVGFGFWK